MKRVVLAAVIVSAVATGVFAQDWFFAFRGAFVDVDVSAPCALKGAASMTVYDRNAWLVFTCTDDRVVLRRYHNPNDDAIPPVAVYTVPNPTAAALPSGVSEKDRCTVPGMVTSIYGGCVTSDHPFAPKH